MIKHGRLTGCIYWPDEPKGIPECVLGHPECLRLSGMPRKGFDDDNVCIYLQLRLEIREEGEDGQ